jgi:hypothetical protein
MTEIFKKEGKMTVDIDRDEVLERVDLLDNMIAKTGKMFCRFDSVSEAQYFAILSRQG